MLSEYCIKYKSLWEELYNKNSINLLDKIYSKWKAWKNYSEIKQILKSTIFKILHILKVAQISKSLQKKVLY